MADTTIEVVRSYAKGVDQAPRKVALVASLVRGRSVADAIVILNHTPRRAALPVRKAIESAQANAVNNHGFDSKTLVIKTLSVTTGTRMKRFKPASRGRALPFQKKTSNILVEVTGELKPKKAAPKAADAKVEKTEAPKPAAKKPAAKKAEAKPAKKEEKK
ncbi:50S ribosomal protein L22 [Candidatus Saccharibacteria bacterium TM7i]|nr:50S ribosomal protein L22 [Candidatus Saccharibacteria bacterium TM7i]